MLSAPAAMAASVGFYAGTFDPPTRAEIAAIRCALGDAALPRECQKIGKKFSRLVVLVDEAREKDLLASTRERVLMVQRALQKYGDRVEVVASASEKGRERRRVLLEDENLAPLVRSVDGGAVGIGEVTDDPVDSAAKEVIEKLGLYQDVNQNLADLQKSLFEEGWKDFVRDLTSACPHTLTLAECAELATRWKAISVVTDGRAEGTDRQAFSSKVRLIYKQSQSEDRWAEKFVQTALAFLHESKNYDKFKPVADDIAARTFQGYPYGKLPHLRRVAVQRKPGSLPSLEVAQKPVACAASRGSYNLDMDHYLADRFPSAFSVFLKEGFRSGSILPVDLYVHDDSIDAAYEFHRRDHYDAFYYLQTRRGQRHRDIYLAVRSNPVAYRVVLTGVRGDDREANVLCQIERAGVFSNYQSVASGRAQPLFTLNTEGISLRLDEDDLLLFGFKGNWTRVLLAQHWKRTPLVQEGLDIDLFTHPAIKQKIVAARNVYGDDAAIVLETFYRKGARRVIYLGSAGAIADYGIGDVVIPNEFVDRGNRSVPFEKNLAQAYQPELADLVTVRGEKKHAWVQTLFEETQAALFDWRANSVGSVDIEGLYLARFAAGHDDLKMAVLFVISDQTLGANTLEQSNAYRGVIDASADRLISFLLARALGPKQRPGEL